MERKIKIPAKAIITPKRKCNRSLFKKSSHWLFFFRETDRFLFMFFFAFTIGYSFRSEKARVFPANLHDNFQFTQRLVKIPYPSKSARKSAGCKIHSQYLFFSYNQIIIAFLAFFIHKFRQFL
jgi:hypothetical protein